MLLDVLIGIVIFAYLIETYLEYLNQKTARNPLDSQISSLYNHSERARSIEYGEEKARLNFYSSSFSTALLILALGFGWFAVLDRWVRAHVGNQILDSLIFIAGLAFISSFLNLPFRIYSTFRIEERYGFNKTTANTFITDSLKGVVLSIVIGGAILVPILWLYEKLTSRFWVLAWGLIALFSLFMFMFGTSLILPLFNKLKPIESGELHTEIDKYCTSQGYSLGRLFVMDGSKRSTKANAFFSGLGKSKTIVLFDTLIEKLTTAEIVAVLAHEIGHYKRKHTLSMFIASNIQSFATFALLGWLLGYEELSTAMGATQASFHLSALAFFILFTPLSMIFGLLNNSWSRVCEYDADTFAKNTYSVELIKSALRKISTDSLANLSPHPLYVAFNYSHPTLLQRLNNLS